MPGPSSEANPWRSIPGDAPDWSGASGVDSSVAHAGHARTADCEMTCPVSVAPPASGSADRYQDGCQNAQQIERDHPLWMVIFGCYSHEYVAFPLFQAPPGTVLAAHYAPALIARMEGAERDYCGLSVRDPAIQVGGQDVTSPGRA